MLMLLLPLVAMALIKFAFVFLVVGLVVDVCCLRPWSSWWWYFFVFVDRWLVINVPLCHYLRSLANSTTIGPYPDFILELDHCSELEHSGLLALLKRRTNR